MQKTIKHNLMNMDEGMKKKKQIVVCLDRLYRYIDEQMNV